MVSHFLWLGVLPGRVSVDFCESKGVWPIAAVHAWIEVHPHRRPHGSIKHRHSAYERSHMKTRIPTPNEVAFAKKPKVKPRRIVIGSTNT